MTTTVEDKPAVMERKPWWTRPEEMERGLDRLMRFTPLAFHRWPRLWPAEEWLPDVDMFRRDGNLLIRADVPGIKPEDLEGTVEGDLLTIKGHREEEKEVKEEDYYCSERARGEFRRTIRLPEGVTADEIEAHRENGVLEVTIPAPRAAEEKAVKIPVK